jgi:hypothetical protein
VNILGSKSGGLDRAQSALDQAVADRAYWEAERAAKDAELEDLESRLGGEALADASAVTRLADQVAGLRAQRDVATAAEVAAGRAVEAAQRGVLRAQAGELRTRATALHAVAAKRQRRTDELLRQLRDHEGSDYVAFEPRRTDTPSGPVTYAIPRTDSIRREAARLEHQAAELERLADAGTPAEVAHAAGLPVPDATAIELEFAGAK